MTNTYTLMDKAFNGMLFERHSIRKYKSQPLPGEDVKQILEAGLLAPSSKSSRPWEFVCVEDAEMLVKLAECKPAGARPLAGAKLAVVICADPEKSDVYVEDCSVAASYMQLQATALGIGSCWIQIRNRYSADENPAQDMVQALLGIPASLPVVAILTFGYSDEQRNPVDPAKLKWEKVHIGQWADDQQ